MTVHPLLTIRLLPSICIASIIFDKPPVSTSLIGSNLRFAQCEYAKLPIVKLLVSILCC